ncbi:MAG TPA: ankyrin repeat domain-containing protein [Candidatus Binatia bacterium]|nr:ankyrin repeat domain-containing protein [Candidatus Binatia bacterium]
MSPETAKENLQDATQELWGIAETDDTAEVEPILARGADINARNAHGVTALMRAASRGRAKMVCALLEHGADPNTSRNDKFTPLMLAAFFGHEDIVKILVEHGAETAAATRFGTSAQMWASSRTFKDVAQYLHDPSATASQRAAIKKPRSQTHSETTSLAGDPQPVKTGIGPSPSSKEAAEVLELAFARLCSAVRRGNELEQLQESLRTADNFSEVPELVQHSDELSEEPKPLKDLALDLPFVPRIRPFRGRPLSYALTTLFLFAAAFVILQLAQSTEVPSPLAPPVTVDNNEAIVSPSLETNIVTPPEEKRPAFDNETFKPKSNQSGEQSSAPGKSTPPLLTPRVVSVGSKEDSRKSKRSEAPTASSTAAEPPVLASRTAEAVSTAAPPVVAPTRKQPQHGAANPAPMKTPVPLPTQVIGNSQSTPSNGKVIQWP